MTGDGPDVTGDGPLPAVDLGEAETSFDPPGDGEGYWAGAPCVHRHDGATYLAVRWRSPERRGYAIAIYERTAPDDYRERTRLTADALDVVSVERPALVTRPDTGALQLYLPVEHGENDWTIRKLDDATVPEGFDPDTARDVLAPRPGTTDEATVKDPCVLTHGGRYYMYYAGHDGVSEQAHLATSPDGEIWARVGDGPVLGRGGWHDHHTRISCVLPVPEGDHRLVCYDGSGREDYGATWNLRTGVAIAEELGRPVDATPDAPWLAAPTADRPTALDEFGTCRYVDVLDRGDELDLFAEVARGDGAFELRHLVVPWP